jgi:dTDP-4-amino-4,6-dideoxygalactose transaminase
MSLYKSKIKLPITEQVANQIVSIPTHPNLTNLEIDKIIHAVNDLYDC